MESQHTYELVYFSSRGLAEGIRYLFYAAGQDFVDNRMVSSVEKIDDNPNGRLRKLNNPKEFFDMKPQLPFGQVPVLIVDGKHKIAQSLAIARFLGNQFDMAGSDDIEKAIVDMVADRVVDLHSSAGVYIETTEEALNNSIDRFVEKVKPVFESLETYLITNDGGDGFFVGKKMTWADTTFAGNFAFIRQIAETYKFELPLEVCPKLVALANRVEAVPSIAAYIAKRPQTDL